ncbi:MAG: PEP-CTERM sorting domain-containing protein [Methylophilaceae bacterium]|nr:PEP-CTERM sorting domain-containing protein [Methylophilaceae bacterium]
MTLVPESNAAAMVLGGLGLMGYVAFRRARNSRLFIGKF